MKTLPPETAARQFRYYTSFPLHTQSGLGLSFPVVIRFAFELCIVAGALFLGVLCSGCTTYKGGKVVDGTNLAIGMRIPGTDWNFNVLDYIGGMRVGAAEGCRLTVTNSVSETNSYFGVVETRRTSTLTAAIDPETPDR